MATDLRPEAGQAPFALRRPVRVAERSRLFGFRLTESEYALAQDCAKSLGLSQSDLGRLALSRLLAVDQSLDDDDPPGERAVDTRDMQSPCGRNQV